MNNVYVLDQSFNIVGVIDEYVSCIWRPAYYDIGDFELYLSAMPELLDLLKINRYLVRTSDIEVNNGVTTYKKVMIIKNIGLNTDVENGDHLKITGKELKYLLHQRIIWRQTNLTGRAEAGIRALVDQNAINPTDTKRVIPNLILDAGAGLTDMIDKQVTGDYLDQTIVDICTAYNYGWEIFINNQKLVFRVYVGLDRSYGQTERPYVVFSDNFDNLFNTDYQINTEVFANCTLVGGEGEGLNRIYRSVGNELTGLNRYETFTDARDLSQNKGTEEEIPLATYYSLLEGRGKENLAEFQNTEGFSGEVLNNVAYKYGIDFYLGDMVTVINHYGITKNVKVLSVIESEDENGSTLVPQFNI